MKREELEALQDWLTSLSGDSLQGATEALENIIAARKPGKGGGGGGGGMPPPGEISIDPDLLDPESLDDGESDPDDIEFDDPDDLLKGKKDTKDKEDDKSKSDKKSSSDKDGETSEEGSDGGDDDFVDDAVELPDELTKDAEEEAKKQNEIFRRKVDLASARKQIKRALKKIDSGEASASPEKIKELEDLDAEAEKRLKELSENPDSVMDSDAEEFNDFINKILDSVDDLGVRHVKIGDRTAKIAKIKADMEDEFTADELAAEDSENRHRDPEMKKLKARELENERIRREMEKDKGAGSFKGAMADFRADLKKAIGDQIQDMIEVEEDTWARVNRHHEDDDMAMPGVRIDDIPDYKKPSIDVYFDQSGSWGTEEVERGMAAIADILELEKEGLLKLEIYYFSEILTQDQSAARWRGGRECWDLVIDNIDAAPKTKNVIIMTDRDIGFDYRTPGQRGCVNGKGTQVDGCVWFLWKDGSRIPMASKKLRGRKGTFEYSV